MRNLLIGLLLVINFCSYAQEKVDATSGATNASYDKSDNTNNMFDNSEFVKLETSQIIVTGEVEQPLTITYSNLPKYSVIVKELPFSAEKTGNFFTGAYKYVGASLIDVLNSVKIAKKNKEEFKPFTDLYIEVENDKGEKAVFSWGEIFFTSDPNKIIIATAVSPVLPSATDDKWELPKQAKIVAGLDYLSVRNISNPTKITVKSYAQNFPGTKHLRPLHSGSFEIYKDNTLVKRIEHLNNNLLKASYHNAFFGGHKGYKGNRNFKGIVFQEAFKDIVPVSIENYKNGLIAFGAPDAYRCIFSVSEIFNRSDLRDVLILDYGSENDGGKYVIHPSIDFFADRTIRAISIIYFSVEK